MGGLPAVAVDGDVKNRGGWGPEKAESSGKCGTLTQKLKRETGGCFLV